MISNIKDVILISPNLNLWQPNHLKTLITLAIVCRLEKFNAGEPALPYGARGRNNDVNAAHEDPLRADGGVHPRRVNKTLRKRGDAVRRAGGCRTGAARNAR